MWRQAEKKRTRICAASKQLQRFMSGNNKPTNNIKPIAASTPLPKAKIPSEVATKPAQKSGGGSRIVNLALIASLGGTAGLGYYVKKNPQFNPDSVKDNVAWQKFREFVGSIDDMTQDMSAKLPFGLGSVLSGDNSSHVEKFSRKDVADLEKAIEKKTAQTQTEIDTLTKLAKTLENESDKKNPLKSSDNKSNESIQVSQSDAAEEDTDILIPDTISSDDYVLVEKNIAEKVAEAANYEDRYVKEEIQTHENAGNKTKTESKTHKLQKMVEDAAAKEQAVINELNHELVTFEEKAKEVAANTKVSWINFHFYLTHNIHV